MWSIKWLGRVSRFDDCIAKAIIYIFLLSGKGKKGSYTTSAKCTTAAKASCVNLFTSESLISYTLYLSYFMKRHYVIDWPSAQRAL